MKAIARGAAWLVNNGLKQTRTSLRSIRAA
jgi:hypothetical protein